MIHLGAAAIVAVLPLVWFGSVLLWVALGWSLYRALSRHALRIGPTAIRAIERDPEGSVSVLLVGNETWIPANILSHFVHPRLTLMTLRLNNRRWPINLVIAADAVEPEAFRRWRVALKLQPVTA